MGIIPLLGQAQAVTGNPLPKAGEIILAPELANSLQVTIGDRVQVGAITVTVSGLSKQEPEIDIAGFSVAPRSTMQLADVEKANLLVQGSQVYYGLRGLVNSDFNIAQWVKTTRTQYEGKSYRIGTRERPSGNIDRIVTTAQDFFMVLSLAIVAISGIGIQMAMRVYYSRNIATLAILKSVGMGHGQVLLFMFSMIGGVALFISSIGAFLGTLVPMNIVPFIQDSLPFPMPSYYPIESLINGILFGVLATYTFSILPVLRAINVKGADLFRSAIVQSGTITTKGKMGAVLLLALSVAFVLNLSSDPERMALFIVALLVGALVLYGLARLCVYGLSKLSGLKNTSLRLAVANLTGKGNWHSACWIVSLGMGLTLFTSVITVYQSVSNVFSTVYQRSSA